MENKKLCALSTQVPVAFCDRKSWVLPRGGQRMANRYNGCGYSESVFLIRCIGLPSVGPFRICDRKRCYA